MQRDQVTALILAGGKATRMGGVDKRGLVIAGRTIFERQVEALAPCVAEVIMSSPWLFVIAGDMPYVRRAFVELVLSRGDDGCDAVGIRIAGLAEPPCTVMRVAAWRAVVVARLTAGRLKASSLLTDEPLRLRWIEEDESRAVDPGLRALHNVNAPEDMSP